LMILFMMPYPPMTPPQTLFSPPLLTHWTASVFHPWSPHCQTGKLWIPFCITRIVLMFPPLLATTSSTNSMIIPWQATLATLKRKNLSMLRLYSRGIGSEGLWPQLIRCAPFPSIAPYFRLLYLSYPKVRTTIIWYPGIETSNVFLSEDKE
jgi:hypothetical protein